MTNLLRFIPTLFVRNLFAMPVPIQTFFHVFSSTHLIVLFSTLCGDLVFALLHVVRLTLPSDLVFTLPHVVRLTLPGDLVFALLYVIRLALSGDLVFTFLHMVCLT